jgi:hypothetical protein
MSSTAVLAQSTSSSTQSPSDPSIAQRKENQQDRIANGIKSGQLTAGETAKLENSKKASTSKSPQTAKPTLTKGEKAQVNHEQNQASKNIYNKKHNSATQGAPRM